MVNYNNNKILCFFDYNCGLRLKNDDIMSYCSTYD